jgi:hypothetical protein
MCAATRKGVNEDLEAWAPGDDLLDDALGAGSFSQTGKIETGAT